MSRYFSAFIISLALTAGCSDSQPTVQPESATFRELRGVREDCRLQTADITALQQRVRELENAQSGYNRTIESNNDSMIRRTDDDRAQIQQLHDALLIPICEQRLAAQAHCRNGAWINPACMRLQANRMPLVCTRIARYGQRYARLPGGIYTSQDPVYSP